MCVVSRHARRAAQPTDGRAGGARAATLLRLGERREVAPREVVWREESQAGFFGYVLDGELELLHCGTKIELLVPGSTFGFLFMICGAYTGGKRETTLVGKSPRGSTLLLISEETWAGLRHTHPELERLMKDGMLRRVAHEHHAFVRRPRHSGGNAAWRAGSPPDATANRKDLMRLTCALCDLCKRCYFVQKVLFSLSRCMWLLRTFP